MNRLLLLLSLAGTGCAAQVARGPAELPNYRVDAVVGFGKGIDNEIIFALRDARRASWSFAPVIGVPATSTGGVSVVSGLADSDQQPLVVVLRSQVGQRPHVSASLHEAVRAASVRAAEAAGGSTRACLGESWIAAFFVAKLGPNPTGPVMVHYFAGDSVFQMRVDPKLHTLGAAPALQLARGDVDVDSTLPERRVVSIQPANTFKPVLPLLLWRDERQWSGGGGTERDGYYGVILNAYRERPPIQEWRLFMLDVPSVC